jgi:hypothetical protein
MRVGSGQAHPTAQMPGSGGGVGRGLLRIFKHPGKALELYFSKIQSRKTQQHSTPRWVQVGECRGSRHLRTHLRGQAVHVGK